MSVIIAGSFTVLHEGHKSLFSVASKTGEKLVIGLTTNAYISSRKTYSGVEFEKRKENLSRYLDGLGVDFEIKPLGDSIGNSTTLKEYTSIVVSPETYANAALINKERVKNGFPALKIILVPFTLGEDLFPIKSSRILSGEIDKTGKRLTPVRVSVPTSNAYKEKAVRSHFSKVIPGSIVNLRTSYSLPSDQPFGEDTFSFARKRASETIADNDYSVALENGLFSVYNGLNYLDITCCCILDKFGKISIGTSSGIPVPDRVVREVKLGKNFGDAFKGIYGEEKVYSEGGIAEIISGGTLKRKGLFDEAIRNAFMPRLNPDYYLKN